MSVNVTMWGSHMPRRLGVWGVGFCVAMAGVARAQDAEPETWSVHAQSTFVRQQSASFSAPYAGPKSLVSTGERSYSFSATAYLGARLWQGGEFYLNPEAVQSVPLSGAQGLGALTSGEAQKSSGPELKGYIARAFWRQTWGLGGESQEQEAGPNQLAGRVDANRVVLTAGTLAVTDVFDRSIYSGDPRSQFLNSAFQTHGAFDYAADARGYTRGLALEGYWGDWALRAGRFMVPLQPNQQELDTDIMHHHGDVLEAEHAHRWEGQEGKVRVLLFRSRAPMARYQDALNAVAATGTSPDLNAVRTADQSKWGVGVGLDQALSDNVGVFARAAWADGQTETYSYVEVDRSLSLGALVKGAAWGRDTDNAGVAMGINAMSGAHQRYLQAGGVGAFLGDGALSYRPEVVVEAFYNIGLCRSAWLGLDFQHIRNPGYNAARGPVNVVALRLHAEF